MHVPPEAWQVGPYNRWAYVHVSEVVPTVPVRRAGPVWEFEAGHQAEHVELPADTDGLAVVRDGALVVERYGGEMGPESLHLSQSVGKSVLGLTVGIVGIDPAALVTDFVPEVAASGYAGATVRHLLDMTAAIAFVEDYAVDFWRYDIACGWHPPVPGADAHTILAYLPTIGPAGYPHGERFHYATPNTDLLGLVVERATNTPLAEVIALTLWGPLGAERDAELTVDPAGTAAIGGGFCATLRDYARLGRLVTEGGRGIVSKAWIDALGRDARPDPISASGADQYGNQWWLRDGHPMARGIHGQLITAGVTILSSWPAAVDPAREAEHRGLVRGLLPRRPYTSPEADG